ncbi:MAG: hypothetical protein KIT22_17240 [Verrucomicrobiae bacterium]|nr:hypothetical protein [Verrucomicrobiae bacterium]
MIGVVPKHFHPMNPRSALASLLLAWVSVALFPAWAQLGLINFSNNFTPPGALTKAFLTDESGNRLVKGLWKLEILDANGTLIRSGTLADDGLFFLGVAEIPGTTPGGSADVILRGWEVSTGASYDMATRKFYITIRLFSLGGGDVPPPSLAIASDFTGGPGWFCGPWQGPDVGISFIEATDAGVRVIGFSKPCSGPWVLETSSDLSQWAQVPNGESHPSEGWLVPMGGSPVTFFRIVLKSP